MNGFALNASGTAQLFARLKNRQAYYFIIMKDLTQSC